MADIASWQQRLLKIREQRQQRASLLPPAGAFMSAVPQPQTPNVQTNNDQQTSGGQQANNGQQSQPTTPPPVDFVPPDLRPQPEQVLLEWMSPARPFKKKDKRYYVTLGLIVGLIALIVLLLGQFLFMAVVLSAGFIAYVLSAVPPGTIHHQITTYGVRTDGQLYAWDELGRFWYETRYQQTMAHIELARFPNRITLMLGELTTDQLTGILSQALLQEKPPSTSFERAAQWLQKQIPLDEL